MSSNVDIPAEVTAQSEALRRKADNPGLRQDYGDHHRPDVEKLISRRVWPIPAI